MHGIDLAAAGRYTEECHICIYDPLQVVGLDRYFALLSLQDELDVFSERVLKKLRKSGYLKNDNDKTYIIDKHL